MIATRNRVNRTTLACILALWLCLASRASAEYESREMNGPNGDASCIEGKCVKRTATQDAATSMWFGPRLGRRRRSDEKEEVNSEMQALADALDSSHLAFVAISDKRQNQYIPRLGRGSGEDLSSYGDAIDRNEIDENDRIIPSIFGARRDLGRRFTWHPPRLGRQLRSIMQKM